jgi:hypothetical protein
MRDQAGTRGPAPPGGRCLRNGEHDPSRVRVYLGYVVVARVVLSMESVREYINSPQGRDRKKERNTPP